MPQAPAIPGTAEHNIEQCAWKVCPGRPSFLLPVLAFSVLSCSNERGVAKAGSDQSSPPQSLASPVNSTHLGHGTVGAVNYSFDDAKLTRAEVELPIPPAFRDRVWAVKLIPAERADMLGQRMCRYGGATVQQTCDVDQEAGLSLAMLERPIEDYRQGFAQAGVGDERIDSTEVGGTMGFAYKSEESGKKVEYRFIPVADRTLMLVQQYGSDLGNARQAFAQVVRGLTWGK